MSENKESNQKYFKIAVISGSIILVLWIGSYFIINCFFFTEEGGSIGDQFGAVNALFSGLAFVGLIVTLIMQRDELGLQREELGLQREETKITNATLKKQLFESTFFQFMTQVNLARDQVTVIDLLGKRVGTDAINGILEQFRFTLQTKAKGNDMEGLKACYSGHISFHRSLKIYIKSLLVLIKYVDDNYTDYNKLDEYISFVKAQLTKETILILLLERTISENSSDLKLLKQNWDFFKDLITNPTEDFITYLLGKIS